MPSIWVQSKLLAAVGVVSLGGGRQAHGDERSRVVQARRMAARDR
jgi:hypothetical protein